MTKWEKLNLKLQLINLTLEHERYYIDHDQNGKPILYWTDGESVQVSAYGIDEIDKRIADLFIVYENKIAYITNFLKERIF